jgi:Ni,Fe-hydrogenase III component G
VNEASVVDARTIARDRLASDFAVQLSAGFRLALVACHEDDDQFRIVYVLTATHPSRIVELVVPVPRDDPWVPTLAALSYPAGRFEREVRDLYGIDPRGHPLPQRLLRHAHWPRGWHPMLRNADPAPTFQPDTGSVPFHEVEGEGVYEIPVGPVHAGLIEPGHFRFSVIGETIIRMKARRRETLRRTTSRRRNRTGLSDQRRHRHRAQCGLRNGRRVCCWHRRQRT